MEREVYDEEGTAIRSEWLCDCREAVGQAGVYAGHQCQFPAHTSCIRHQHHSVVSEYAFCTNGGSCRAMVAAGAPHPGCRCTAGFEGRHCQYREGTAPRDELVYEARNTGSDNDDGMSGFGIFLVVMLCLAFAGGVGYLLLERRRKSTQEETTANSTIPTDLQLEEEQNIPHVISSEGSEMT